MSAAKKKLDTDKMTSELSESAFFQQPTSGQVVKPTKPQVDKYTTHLHPESIEYIKRYAFEHKMKDYEVVQMAIDRFQESEMQPIALAPVAQPLPVEQKSKTPAPEVPPLPDDLVSFVAFTDLHGVNRNEAKRLQGTGAFRAVKGVWTVGKQTIVLALNAKGRRGFWAQYHETPGFRACDDCPHDLA